MPRQRRSGYPPQGLSDRAGFALALSEARASGLSEGRAVFF